MLNASKMSVFRQDFDETKYISFLIKNGKFWDKVNNTIKTEFGTGPVCNEKYLGTEIKSYEDKISTNFLDNEIPNKILNVFAYW